MKISYYLPDKMIGNEVFEELGWSSEQVFSKTGIQTRRVCAESEFALDLAEKACKTLFREHAIDPAAVGYLLYCTQSPDSIIPTNACVLQSRLGLPNTVGALDFNLGCSGFVYGLSLAKGLLLTGQTPAVLLVTAETYSKYIHPADRSNRAIFGDGAAATFLTADDARRMGAFVHGTDGAASDALRVKYSGLRGAYESRSESPVTDAAASSGKNLQMQGPEIFNLTIHHIPLAVSNLLKKSDLRLDQIDHFVFHQANAYMLECLREKIQIPPDRFHVDLEHTGNTVSSTIPILLKNLMDKKIILPGQKVLIAGFGVGYSWAAAVLEI